MDSLFCLQIAENTCYIMKPNQGETMFRKIRRLRRRERVWELLKERNPELTRERFDTAYDNINYSLQILAEIQK
jgi:hypothetical protein